MPSTDRDELEELIADTLAPLFVDGKGVVYHQRLQKKTKEIMQSVDSLITQKQKEAQLHILQKVNTIRKGESASVEVIAKHVSEELIAFQSPDREEDKR